MDICSLRDTFAFRLVHWHNGIDKKLFWICRRLRAKFRMDSPEQDGVDVLATLLSQVPGAAGMSIIAQTVLISFC
jgi:hypothetical protein